jgi:hypothetical protein
MSSIPAGASSSGGPALVQWQSTFDSLVPEIDPSENLEKQLMEQLWRNNSIHKRAMCF